MADEDTVQIVVKAFIDGLKQSFEEAGVTVDVNSKKIGDSVRNALSGVDRHLQDTEGHSRGFAATIADSFRRVVESSEETNAKLAFLKDGFAAVSELLLVGLGVEKFVEAMHEFGEGAVQVTRLAYTMGLTIEQAAQLQGAFQLLDTDAQSAMRAINHFNEELLKGDAAGKPFQESLKRLGISMEELQGKNAIEQLKILADGFKKVYEEGVNPTAYAISLFGQRVGGELVPVLVQGAEKFQEAADKARELGGVTAETAAAGRQVSEAWTEASQAGKGLGESLGTILASAFADLTEEFRDSIAEGGALRIILEGLAWALRILLDVVVVVVAAIRDLLVEFRFCVSVIADVVTGFSKVNDALHRLDFAGARAAIKKTEDDIAADYQRMADSLIAEQDRVNAHFEKQPGVKSPEGPGAKTQPAKLEDAGAEAWMKKQQDALETLLVQKHAYGEEGKRIELAYWENLLNTATAGSDRYLAIQSKIYALRNDAAKHSATVAGQEATRAAREEVKAFEDGLKDILAGYDQRRAAAHKNADQLVQIDREQAAELLVRSAQVQQQLTEDTARHATLRIEIEQRELYMLKDAYRSTQKELTRDLVSESEQRKQITEIEFQSSIDSEEQVVQRRIDLLQFQVEQGQITDAQSLDLARQYEDELFQIALGGLQKRLGREKEDSNARAGINADIERLEQEHQNRLTKIDQDAERVRQRYLVQGEDVVRQAMGDTLLKMEKGTGSLKELFNDLLSSIREGLLRIINERLVEQLFGQTGTAGGGSAGGGLGSILGSIFGGASGGSGGGGGLFSGLFGAIGGLFGGGGAGAAGGGDIASAIGPGLTLAPGSGGLFSLGGVPGLAAGGWALPNSVYEVAERGTEILSTGGRTYMITGSQGGEVTPVPPGSSSPGATSSNRSSSQSFHTTNIFNVPPGTDLRTQGQVSTQVAASLATWARRNG